MKRHENKLKEKVGTRNPYTLPDGYFESFKSGLMDSLPEFPAKPKQKRLSPWQRIKPYAYLAAMFAGIWCMMQIFHHVSNSTSHTGSDREEIAFSNFEPDTYDYYIDDSNGDDIEIQEEVLSLYNNMDDFKRDFYAQR